MDFLNNPVSQEKQNIIDTDEIIKNFREIVEIMTERIEHAEEPMLNIGRKLALTKNSDTLKKQQSN